VQRARYWFEHDSSDTSSVPLDHAGTERETR
jgi:hypothetical protein